jgi:hypothetical protein
MRSYWEAKHGTPDMEVQVMLLLECVGRSLTFLDLNPAYEGIFPGRSDDNSQEKQVLL